MPFGELLHHTGIFGDVGAGGNRTHAAAQVADGNGTGTLLLVVGVAFILQHGNPGVRVFGGVDFSALVGEQAGVCVRGITLTGGGGKGQASF